MPLTQVTFTVQDYSDEKSFTSFRLEEITAANFDAVMTNVADLRTDYAGLILGDIVGQTISIIEPIIVGSPTNNPNAQRERKFIFTYQDITASYAGGDPNPGYGKLFTFEVPAVTLDPSVLPGFNLKPRSDEVDLASGPVAALISEVEAHALSPYGGAINVLGARYVGRNT